MTAARPSIDLLGESAPSAKADSDMPDAPWSFNDEGAVVAYEREVRRHRAHREAFHVELSARDSFRVTGSSGGVYVVDVVRLTRATAKDHEDLASCSCPDFIHGRLGVCKHVEAVRRVLAMPKRRRRGVDLASAPLDPRASLVARKAPDGIRVAIASGDAARRRELEEALSATYRDGELVVAPQAIERLMRSEASDRFRLTEGALEAARVRDRQARRRERAREVRRSLEEGRLSVEVLSVALFPYQREGVAHLVTAGRAVLADDMGLGKTVQTIAACEVLRRRGEAKRILIVCPASLKAQWASEIARCAGAPSVVVDGDRGARRAAYGQRTAGLQSDVPYVILNYELALRDRSILSGLAIDVLVLDEAQRAKNFRTRTAATLKSIPSEHLFVLTGTPIENKLDDLYGILQLVDADVLGPLWKFNLDYQERAPSSGKLIGYKNLGALRKTIESLVLRRRKEHVLAQLPPLTEQTRYVPISDAQRAIDRRCREEAFRIAAIAERRTLRPDEQKKVQRLFQTARRACNAASLVERHVVNESPPKLEELSALVSEIAEQGGAKVLVFSEWTEMLELAATKLDVLGIGHLTLHGGVPSTARPALLERFRGEPDKIVLLSTDAGGLGLNLQVASYVIHLDLPWNPARLDQRTARAHRIGQTRGVSVTYLCAEEGIERGIEGTLAPKRSVRSAAIDADSDVEMLDAPNFVRFMVDEEVNPPLLEPDPQPPQRRSDARGIEAFAQQRLRLAHVVLQAGFPGDAVAAAYEAVAASLRSRLHEPAGDDHTSLIAAIHRELLPRGAIPMTVCATLSKIHDLAGVAELGQAVDATLAAECVEEARAWLERPDAFGA